MKGYIRETIDDILKTTVYFGVKKISKPLIYIALGYGAFKGCEDVVNNYFDDEANNSQYSLIKQNFNSLN